MRDKRHCQAFVLCILGLVAFILLPSRQMQLNISIISYRRFFFKAYYHYRRHICKRYSFIVLVLSLMTTATAHACANIAFIK
jgi:hypothetical protein